MGQNLDLPRFEALLEQRIADLLQLLDGTETRSQSVELDQSKVGRLSRMDALQQQAMADAVRSRATREHSRLLVALQRYREGEYGYCVECGEPIAIGRLEFDPATPLCIGCASASESR